MSSWLPDPGVTGVLFILTVASRNAWHEIKGSVPEMDEDAEDLSRPLRAGRHRADRAVS
jgi:hypothetical protein